MNDTRTLKSLLADKSISEVARRVGKGRAAIYRWINEDCVPSVADLPALAHILEMDVADLTKIVLAAAERISARKAA